MRRPISALLMTAVAAIPAGCSSATTSPSTPTPTAPTQTAAPSESASSVTFTGPAVDMQWGPVQVTITVQGNRLTDVQATAPNERPRSAFINQQAVPILRQEALQAQSANIDVLSGATMTSEAYADSLQAALQKAHL